jgi:hypothetical protein
MILVSQVDTGCDTKEPYNILYLSYTKMYIVLNKGNLHIYNTERTLRLYLSAMTDINIITPLSYPLK